MHQVCSPEMYVETERNQFSIIEFSFDAKFAVVEFFLVCWFRLMEDEVPGGIVHATTVAEASRHGTRLASIHIFGAPVWQLQHEVAERRKLA